MKCELGYYEPSDLTIYNNTELLDDSNIINKALDEDDELNGVVSNQNEAFKGNVTNFASKKVKVIYNGSKILNLDVGQQKGVKVTLPMLWGSFQVLREMDVKEDEKTVFKGFFYTLPKADSFAEIEITENNVLEVKKDKDRTRVVLIPEGEPQKRLKDDILGDDKGFHVENEGTLNNFAISIFNAFCFLGPEIYLLTGTKTSFIPYQLPANSNSKVKIKKSKRFSFLFGSQYHFGLCKKALNGQYTAYIYDAEQVFGIKKIIIANSQANEGPTLTLLGKDGRRNTQDPLDFSMKQFREDDIIRLKDWLNMAQKLLETTVSVTGLALEI